LLEGDPLGAELGDVEGNEEGALLTVGLSLGADEGKKLPDGAALGSPHSTLTGSQGISTRYAQKVFFPPKSDKSSTLQASHSSGSKSSSMYTTTRTLAEPS